jgi:hypothetical protein
MSSTQPASANKKAKVDWPLIVSLLGLLIGSGAIFTVVTLINQSQPPQFKISAINTLAGHNIYEVTNHIISGGDTEAMTITWGLEVTPQYSGNDQFGEVRVTVKDQQGHLMAEGKWDNFSRDATVLKVPLDPHKLCVQVRPIGLYGGFEQNIFKADNYKPPEAVFDIAITRASSPQTPLLTDTLTVRNAPWYHYTAMSAWHGDGKDAIDAYVYARNLGDPADFYVIGEVFEIAAVPGVAWDQWPWVDYRHAVVPNVGSGQEFTATLSFPAKDTFKFEDGKAYLVNIYVIKRQNYVVFADQLPLPTSIQSWRFGSFVTQHLLNRN